MKRGLVMEGGAMRGMFTCGVLDVFMENGIEFEGAVGISAGAVFGCNYKSGQVGRPIRYNKKYAGDPRYCSFRSLLRTGDLYGENFCYHELPNILDPFDREAFRQNPMDFYIGATDIRTGECLFHKCTDGGTLDLKWMQASASMPLVSRPVPVEGKLMLDGGITDSIPFAYMESIGYEKNVIILTQADDYVKKKTSAIPLARLMLRKYPALIHAMEIRHEMYNRQLQDIREREKSGRALVIRPVKSLGISRTEKDPQELERVYQLGRREAEKKLPEIRQFG